jgi:hypothetical protein
VIETNVTLKRILPDTWLFQVENKLSLFQISLYSRVQETHKSLERNPSVLEAVAASIFFPHWIELFSVEYFKQLLISKWRKAHFFQILYTERWRNTCISRKKTTCVRSKNLWHIASLLKLISFFKGILPVTWFFQGEDRLSSSK